MQYLMRGLGYVLGYALWNALFKMVVLTLITYLLMSPSSHFQEISDVYASNEMIFLGLGSALFVGLLRGMNPISSTTTQEIFTRSRIERRYLPGYLQGTVLAFGICLAFLLGDIYRYLGIYIQADEALLTLLNISLRVVGLILICYAEEFIFRHKILNYLRRSLSESAAVLITSVAYVAVKFLQLDLGLMQSVTLFIVSIALCLRAIRDGDFSRGAGLLAGFLVLTHPVFSLPIFGNEFQGLVLLKYEVADGMDEKELTRLLSGGAGGPLSSFALQVLIVFDIAQSLFKGRKLRRNSRQAAHQK